MKLLIDLDRALAEGKISREEHARLQALGSGQTSDLALNILIGFGAVAVTGGFLALFPSALTVAGTGGLLAVTGLGLIFFEAARWRILGEVLLVVGSALLAGGLVMLDHGSTRSLLAAAALFAAGAALACNGLLAALSVLALAGALGARSGYLHATYMLGLQKPTWTILTFAALGVGLVGLSGRLPSAQARLAVIAARTSALLVSLGFWIGSLWGDRIGGVVVSRAVFAVLWAVALAGVAGWAWRTNRRWPLIAATIFAAIHFYTQWFERLGAAPLAVLLGGLAAIAIGLGLKSALAGMPTRSTG